MRCLRRSGSRIKTWRSAFQPLPADPHESGVRGDVPGRGRGVAGNVDLADHIPEGEAAGDAVEHIEDPGEPREALFVLSGR